MPARAFSAVVTASIRKGAQYECGEFARAIAVVASRDEQASIELAENRPVACNLAP
jgi:hypothetical protein